MRAEVALSSRSAVDLVGMYVKLPYPTVLGI